MRFPSQKITPSGARRLAFGSSSGKRLAVLIAVAAAGVATLWISHPGAIAADPVFVFAGGTLIDGTGGSPVKDAVVVVRQNRIAAAGPRSQVTIPQDAQVIDITNQFILPGLIESHTHFADWFPGELLLSFGVTTVVNYSAPGAKGREPGNPRYYYSGATLGEPVQSTILGRAEVGEITSAERAREEVRRRKDTGATFIKTSENLRTEWLAVVTDEAHRLGLPVIGHQVDAGDAVRNGLDGVEHVTGLAYAAIKNQSLLAEMAELNRTKGPTRAPISHPISNPEFHMDMAEVEKILELMVQRNAYLNPTLVTRWQRVQPRTQEFFNQYKAMSEDAHWSSIPENVRKSWMETLIPYPEWTHDTRKEQERIGYRKNQELMRKFVSMGGKIFSGTDVAGASVPGLRLHQELLLLTDAGLTPMQALLTATRYAAEIMRLDRDLGTVQAGKLADLIVVDADPLARIQNLGRIRHVMLDGKVVPVQFHAGPILDLAD